MAGFRIIIFFLAGALALGAGCRRPVVAPDDEHERADPAVQAAWSAYEAGDPARAEGLYDAILAGRPDLARAHLDLAMLLMSGEEKPVKAIHHFMRYLELRPEAQSRDLIAQNIRKLTVTLGGKAAKSRIGQLEYQVATLQAENEALRRALGLTGIPLVNVPGAPPAVPPPATAPRAYTVQAGDSLTRIAQLMYGNGDKAGVIFEANRGRLKNQNVLQAGQVLVIP